MNWRKPTRSGGQGGNCLEAANDAGRVFIRDSKDKGGSVLAFQPGAWRRFAEDLKRRLALVTT